MALSQNKRLPLREAYAFAGSNGLSEQAEEIRDMEIDWDRPYTSSVRRGRIVRLFEEHCLISKFIAECWPFGATEAGTVSQKKVVKIAGDFDIFLAGRDCGEEEEEKGLEDRESMEFALEAHLRDFLAKNLDQIEPGLTLVKDSRGEGIEYPVDNGRIDILALDQRGGYVVIELKLAQGRNKALGQILYYMGWVDQNLGHSPCRGMVIANEISEPLEVAVSRAPGVALYQYKMSFSLEPVVRIKSKIIPAH